ncbi:MAG: class I SAM-dependent methyltransferase [FCB group bacterium]|nr:class I SAM-dependent methyltransferase [FCB group bacterium]
MNQKKFNSPGIPPLAESEKFNKFHLSRFIGDIFCKLKIHNLFRPVLPVFKKLIHISELSEWISAHAHLRFNDFFTLHYNYESRLKLYEAIFTSQNLNRPINYLEFGVAGGNSFSWWHVNNDHPDSTFYGFDTFTGLPEDWGVFKKGHFSTDGNVPKLDDSRCVFIKGLFQSTLQEFIKETTFEKRNVIHIDSDLYTSCLFVLTTLAPKIKPDDILIFDDFKMEHSEFRAMINFMDSFHFDYEVIGAANNYSHVAIRIIKIKRESPAVA